MPKKPNRLAKTGDVAEEFSVSPRTVHEWVSKGCPCTRGARGNLFDLAEVAAWKQANGVTGEPGRPKPHDSADIEAAKLRKENALASKYELQVEKERGRLVDIDIARSAGVQVVTTYKNKFHGYGAATAPQLQGLDAAEIQTRLETDIEKILNDLANDLQSACRSMAGSIEAPAEVPPL